MTKETMFQAIDMLSSNVEIVVYKTIALLITELQKKKMSAEQVLAYLAATLNQRAEDLQKEIDKHVDTKN